MGYRRYITRNGWIQITEQMIKQESMKSNHYPLTFILQFRGKSLHGDVISLEMKNVNEKLDFHCNNRVIYRGPIEKSPCKIQM